MNPLYRSVLPTLATICAVIFTPLALAGPGHSHDEPTVHVGGPTLPKLQAHSDTFELVGTLEGAALRITLDDYATNAPVGGAKLELEATRSTPSAQTLKAVVQTDAAGEALWTDDAFKAPGQWSVNIVIQKDSQTDLLTAELDAMHTDEAPDQKVTGLSSASSIKDALPWLGAGAVVVIALLLGARRLRDRRKALEFRASALALGLTLATAGLITPDLAWAGGDHSEPSVQASGNAPRRLSDGSVFLPKATQRQLEVRTQIAVATQMFPTVELNGRVIADPGAGGRVQSAQGGRFAATARGLPTLGQRIVKGEVIAVVTPVVAAPESASQKSQVAEARVGLELARSRVQRLEQLEGSVPQREIDVARAEVSTLQARIKSLEGGINATEVLTAPATGVIAAVNVVAGQVVAPNEVLFEIVDPTRLRIEALAYDPSIAAGLKTVGVGRILREQAIPILFKIENANDLQSLAVGQPVVVRAQRASAPIAGIRLPASALVKNPSNLDIVWVHTDAEVFVPKAVQWKSIDGATIAVTQGLATGDRIVVRAAPLLNQVR
jgi:membrane fusion protein, heavy metal efflux system